MTLVAAAPAGATRPDTTLADGDGGQGLRDDIVWLVQLRWLAVVGVFVALLISRGIGWEPTVWRPALVAVLLAATNLVLWLLLRRGHAAVAERHLPLQILVQLLIDLLALAFLVRWTGGVANPFVMFLVFPVAIGAITLSTRAALVVGTAAFLLFSGLVVCALYSSGPSMPLGVDARHSESILQHSAFVVALLTAAAMTLFGVVYFIRTVVGRHERAEQMRQQHARVAQSRERMARVGMIAAGVAHSVRNPLHGVLNCIDLLRGSDDAQETEATLELMQEGLQRIEQVTSRLLSLSRDGPLAPQVVDLDQLVVDTIALLAVRAHRLGITLRTELGGVRELCIDPVRVQEALFNILDNAFPAVVEAGSNWVLVRTGMQSQPFPGAFLEVQDPGVGVEAANIDQVFNPFYTTKPVGEGTGLGLAIAKEVVEAHGGVIRFQSQRHNGTTVRIVLPSHASATSVGEGS